MPANFKKFDVKHGITVNGLPFVDENRNVTLNNLTVQGTSTVIDTRTITSVDPIISLGTSGTEYTAASVATGTPGRIFFDAEAFADIAVGDSIEYTAGTEAIAIAGGAVLTDGGVYYVKSKESDVNNTSGNYRSITISDTQGGTELDFTGAGSNGDQKFTLNPLRDLNQDLGIEFNYVDINATDRKGFFGYKDSTEHFTFLLAATYGSTNVDANNNPISDDGETGGTPTFTGTKGGVDVKSIKLEPSSALTTSSPGIDLDQAWNDANIIFEAIDVDITDTASEVSSKFLNFAAGGYTKFAVRKDGALTLGTADGSTDAAYNGFLSVDGRNNSDLVLVDLQDTWNSALDVFTGIDLTITNTASAGTSKLVNFFSTDDRKYELYWDGHSVQEVEFTGGGAQTAITVNVTDTSSADDSYLLDLQVADTSVFSIKKDGFVSVAGPGEFHDSITLETQTPGASTYEDNTQFQTDLVYVAPNTSTPTTINSMPAATFVTAKLLVQVKQGSNNYHSTELMLVHNGADVYLTEYGTVYTSNILGTFDASISTINSVQYVNIIFTKTAAAVAAGTQAQIRTTRLAMVA